MVYNLKCSFWLIKILNINILRWWKLFFFFSYKSIMFPKFVSFLGTVIMILKKIRAIAVLICDVETILFFKPWYLKPYYFWGPEEDEGNSISIYVKLKPWYFWNHDILNHDIFKKMRAIAFWYVKLKPWYSCNWSPLWKFPADVSKANSPYCGHTVATSTKEMRMMMKIRIMIRIRVKIKIRINIRIRIRIRIGIRIRIRIRIRIKDQDWGRPSAACPPASCTSWSQAFVQTTVL